MERRKDTPKSEGRKTIKMAIHAGVPTQNNRVCEEILKTAYEEVKQKSPCLVTNTRSIDGVTRLGEVSAVLEGAEEYQVQVKVLPTPAGKDLQNFIDKFGTKALVVSPVGYGTLRRREDGVDEVENYSLSSFSLELKSHMEGSERKKD